MRQGWLALVLVLSACAPGATGPPPTQTLRLPTPSSTPWQPSPSPTSSPPTAIPTPLATPQALEDELGAQSMAMKEAFLADLGLMGTATRYLIDLQVHLDPQGDQARLQGVARIRYFNAGSDPLPDLALMLWPNDEQYLATMQAGPVLVDGREVPVEVLLDGLALLAKLDPPLEPGAWLDASVPFRIQASGPIGGAVPRRFGITRGVLVAPTFYPLVPPRREGTWDVLDAPPGGDTTTSETAFYTVRIDAPADLVLVASGTALQVHEEEGRRRVTYVSGPMRDFAIALGPFKGAVREVDGTLVRAWYLPEHEEDGGRMLQYGAEQFGLLSEMIMPYPYRELDLVDAPGAYGGIEYPGLVFIGTLGTPGVMIPVVHEVGHQWFYALIGDDQIREPWLDEGAATFTQILYFEEYLGSGRAARELSDFRAWLRSASDPSKPIGLPVGAYADSGDYALMVYIKGALFFETLRAEMGEQAFRRFLGAYAEAFRYRIASGAEFQRLAEESCACELDALFDLWVFEGGEIELP